LAWFGRGAEKERAYKRLEAVQEEYGAQGGRVVGLSRRTESARATAGSTRKALESVEEAFYRATQEYARIGDAIAALQADLERGRTSGFKAVEEALRRLPSALDELERSLAAWEESWRAAPRRIEAAAQSLAELRHRVEQAAALIGAPLPLAEQVANLEAHLEKIRQTLAAGNPLEAIKQVEDLQIAQRRVSDQVSNYSSGAGAIAQAEQEVAEVRARLARLPEPPAEAVGALAAAESLLPRLRPALAAGRLDPFQNDLYQLQRHLSTARAATK
jgi:chromosome segregation ATPase